MNDVRRLNVRLGIDQYRKIETLSRRRGITIAEYIRSLIDGDLNSGEAALRRSLARHAIFSAHATQQLLKISGDDDDLNAAWKGYESTVERLGLADPLADPKEDN